MLATGRAGGGAIRTAPGVDAYEGIGGDVGRSVEATRGGTLATATGVMLALTRGSGESVARAVGDATGDALAAGDATAAADAVALGNGAGVAVCAGLGDAVGVGAGDGDGDAVGTGDGVGASVASMRGPVGCGTGVTAGTDVAPSSGTVPRFWNADTSAPMPRPATITPIANATVGNGPPPVPPPLLRRGGGCVEERRRRESGSGIASRFPRIRQEALPLRANAPSMIRVRVPIDVNAVLCADSTAFALATPLRVGELLTHAVLDALGPRAPQDKRERTIARTHAGLNDGSFILEIDGRIYEHCDDVAVVAGIANLRFYRRERRDTAA